MKTKSINTIKIIPPSVLHYPGFLISPSVDGILPMVYVQVSFVDNESKFEQKVDLIYSIELLNLTLARITHWENMNRPIDKGKTYSDIRFHLVYKYLEYDRLSEAILHFICCFSEMKKAIQKFPLGGYKVILNFDMCNLEDVEIEVFKPNLLDETDIKNIRETRIYSQGSSMTLKSKLGFLSDYQIDVLKKLISFEISGKGIILYPTTFLDELNIPLEERERFMGAFWRIKDCELIKLSRMPIGKIVVKYELKERGLVEDYFLDKETRETEIVQSNDIQN